MSATDDALDALARRLEHMVARSDVVELLRNEDLAARFQVAGSGVQSFANLWDGSQLSREEMLGADVDANGFEIVHGAQLELAFLSLDEAARRGAHDRALIAVFDLIAEDRTLGGKVDDVRIGELQGPGSNLITDGLPGAKGVVVPIALTFLSSRPF